MFVVLFINVVVSLHLPPGSPMVILYSTRPAKSESISLADSCTMLLPGRAASLTCAEEGGFTKVGVLSLTSIT